MKKIMKFILGLVAAVFIIIAVLWGSFVYASDYKITEADTSVSPDGTHNLVLQAVGEAGFPFGSASGRLILYERKSKNFDGRKEVKQLTDWDRYGDTWAWDVSETFSAK